MECNEIVRFFIHAENIKQYKKWDIIEANLPKQSGSVQYGKRPVLIISNNTHNKFSPTLTVVPLTTKRKRNLPTHVTIEQETALKLGLQAESTVTCESPMTINKSCIIGSYGTSIEDIELRMQIARAEFVQEYGIDVAKLVKDDFFRSCIKTQDKKDIERKIS